MLARSSKIFPRGWYYFALGAMLLQKIFSGAGLLTTSKNCKLDDVCENEINSFKCETIVVVTFYDSCGDFGDFLRMVNHAGVGNCP